MDSLPPEVVHGVLVALGDGHQVALSCALVCRQWAALASDPALWKALVHRLPHLPLDAPPVVVGDRWKEAYFALSRRTRHATVALLGQSHVGKSTLFDLLRALHPLAATKNLSEVLPAIAEHARVQQTLQREPTRASRCGELLLLQEPRCHLTLVDLPCDRAYVKNFWRNLVGAHCCVLVVSADSFDAGAGSRQQPLAAVIAGIKHLVVAINKTDSCPDQWNSSSTRMDEIVAHLSRSLAIAGVPSGATQFVPISAARGTNIVRRDPQKEFPWYDGPTLLSALRRTVDSVPSINSLRWRWNLSVARPLRLCVLKVTHGRSVDPKHGMRGLSGDEAVVVGTIMCGTVCVGDELVIAPLGVEAVTVVEIQLNNRNRPMAHGPYTRVGLLVRFGRQRSFPGASHMPASQVASFKRGYVRQGVVMGRAGELSPTRQVASFEAKVIVVQLSGRIHNRYESVIRCHTAAVCCRWELLAKTDKRTGAVIEESPQFLRRGEAGIVRLTPREPLYLETHISDGHLGRIVNYENMMITAFGIVEKIEWLEHATPLYLRMKQPRQKVQRVGTVTVTVEDGYIQADCPWRPGATVVQLGLTEGRNGEQTQEETTCASLSTCRPAWHQSFTFTNVDVRRMWLWCSMHDTESGREYGEKTLVALSGLLSTDSFGRRLGMQNIYNLNNYINIRAQFQDRA